MNNTCEEQWFLSSDGSHMVSMTIWRPQTQAKGIVQILHGMREYTGRYADFAAFLCQQGFVVCGHDHLGHGRTAQHNGPYGHFGDRDGCRWLLRDCRKASELIRAQYPYRPLFVLGHSMGSFLGRVYILQAEELAGFICMGTGEENKLAPYGKTMAQALVRAAGPQAEGALLDKLAFSPFAKRFGGEGSPSAWLSRDKTVARQYDKDPHCQPIFTAQGFSDLFTLMMAATGRKWFARVDKALPVLLVSGAEDPVGGYGRGVVSVYERLKLAGALDVSCKLYPGARHEVLNEINREEVYYDLLTWLAERLPRHQAEARR